MVCGGGEIGHVPIVTRDTSERITRMGGRCAHDTSVARGGRATVGGGRAAYFMFYNFAPVHQTQRVTAAMAAGVSDHV
jgi:hypothetical protein